MAGETVITVVGNVTADPELRFTANGAAVANFTVASTPRTFDRQTSEWRDGETLFLRCSAWREMAENVAETLSRGTRVVAQGRLRSRTFDTKEGERRTVFELDVDEVGPSLRYASANVTKNERGGGFSGGGQGGQQGGFGGGGQGGGQQGGFGGGRAPQQGSQQGGQWGANPQQGGRPAQEDPWASSNPQSGGGWGSPTNDEPPF
ncbi:MAG: single-stranded DNA-binding protein [Brevibacterium yomogidense]|uniref:Single-stranded DNA-binding protein n=1 Tax=Brevibacterium yomogidense TaxID=946573 RepID=A0A1X6WY59_9MICO|nr:MULTISPECIES: single-stranded DNA-binding protein [Brevibacterium]SLM90784.1 Single-stranded DNA-binding protein [Brevibacterium yomogidense]SMX82681.1 single-strand binding protein [Brevibacterium sp. Mu109]